MGVIRIIDGQKKIAHKIHHCYKCGKEIQIGEEYKKVVYSSDGNKCMIKACLGCDIELRMVLV